MSLPRIALSLILTLALAAAPVMPALAMAAALAPDSAGMHAAHAAQPDAAAGHNQHQSCAQHDSCNGTCCASCAQSIAGVVSFQLQSDVVRPVLTPSVHHLSFSCLFSLHDRPPRLLSI